MTSKHPAFTPAQILQSASWILWVMHCHLLYSFKCVIVVMVFTIHNILYLTAPGIFRKLAVAEGKVTGLCAVVPTDNFIASLRTWGAFETILSDLYFQTFKEVTKGSSASNTKVVHVENNIEQDLLDFAKPGRPLVVNFGSITCPIFTSEIVKFNEACVHYGQVADFLMVYTMESHAEDGWKLENAKYVINKHRTLLQRLSAAKMLKDDIGVHCPLTVDCMGNETTLAYGAMPMRLFVIKDGMIQYEGKMGPMGYSVQDVISFLEYHTQQLQARI